MSLVRNSFSVQTIISRLNEWLLSDIRSVVIEHDVVGCRCRFPPEICRRCTSFAASSASITTTKVAARCRVDGGGGGPARRRGDTTGLLSMTTVAVSSVAARLASPTSPHRSSTLRRSSGDDDRINVVSYIASTPRRVARAHSCFEKVIASDFNSKRRRSLPQRRDAGLQAIG